MKKLISLAAAIVLAATATTSSLFVPATADINDTNRNTDFYFGLEQTLFNVTGGDFDSAVSRPSLNTATISQISDYVDSNGVIRDINRITLPWNYEPQDLLLGIYAYNMPTYTSADQIPAGIDAEVGDVVAVSTIAFQLVYDAGLPIELGFSTDYIAGLGDPRTDMAKYTGGGIKSPSTGESAGATAAHKGNDGSGEYAADRLGSSLKGTTDSKGILTTPDGRTLDGIYVGFAKNGEGMYFEGNLDTVDESDDEVLWNRSGSVVNIPLTINTGLEDGKTYKISLAKPADYKNAALTTPTPGDTTFNYFDTVDFEIVVEKNPNSTEPDGPILGNVEFSAKTAASSTTVAYDGTKLGENAELIGYVDGGTDRIYQFIPLTLSVKGDVPIETIAPIINFSAPEGVEVYTATHNNAKIGSGRTKYPTELLAGYGDADNFKSLDIPFDTSGDSNLTDLLSPTPGFAAVAPFLGSVDDNRKLFANGVDYLETLVYVEYPADATEVSFDVIFDDRTKASVPNKAPYYTKDATGEFVNVDFSEQYDNATFNKTTITLSDGTTPTTHTITIVDANGVAIADKTISLKKGATKQLYALDSLGHTDYVWSDDSDLVTVDANGKVTVTGNPASRTEATITVTCGDVSDTLVITVANTPSTPETPGTGWTPGESGGSTETSPGTGDASGVVAALAVIGLAGAAAWTARKKR
jgi:hypothetical protein